MLFLGNTFEKSLYILFLKFWQVLFMQCLKNKKKENSKLG